MDLCVTNYTIGNKQKLRVNKNMCAMLRSLFHSVIFLLIFFLKKKETSRNTALVLIKHFEVR